jgi:protoporphyrin/coproporphyrin ferrochelatase
VGLGQNVWSHDDLITEKEYDALVVVSFGGPEKNDDVMPFLENVVRGRNVPRERLEAVAQHYYELDGVSPINQQNRELIAALQVELADHGIDLPIYFGNRNWHPLLEDTVSQMKRDGINRALAFVTSAFSCYSGCRQYLEDIERARSKVHDAPQIEKIRCFFNHPGFIDTMVDRMIDAGQLITGGDETTTRIVFTAHSIPQAMADKSDYQKQLRDACQSVASTFENRWDLVYQSRSGPPTQPWLEPDICDFLRSIPEDDPACKNVLVVPIGFVSDHMEVINDLDDEAQRACDEVGLKMFRAKTAGTHPTFVSMVRELIEEHMGKREVETVGDLPAQPAPCKKGCCPPR